MTTAFLGMRGTGDWGTDVRPKSFREGILRIFPNGSVPLTAITAMGRSESVDDPEFSFWDKNLEVQSGDLEGSFVHDDPLMASATGSGALTAGNTVYLKCKAAVATHFRVGHTALLVLKTNASTFAFGKITGVQINGDISRLTFVLKADAAANIMDTVNFVDVVGNANPEGGVIPDALTYDPTKFTNFTQIFRTALDITRTAKKTRLRTGDAKAELQRDTLLYHGVELEQAFIMGEKSEVTGANGKPERTTQGMIPFIKENANAVNIEDFAAAQTLTWRVGGEDWFDDKLEILFRFGSSEPVALCGNGALRGIQKLVKLSGEFELTSETAAYGVKVVRWTTPFGDVLLKRHPLFTHKSYRHNDMVFFRPENLRFRFIDDTMYKKDDSIEKSGFQAIDGEKDEYLTEAGFEFHFPNTMMYLTSVGLDPA